MGRGYVNYTEPYKSAPGSKAAPLGYTYSQEKNTAVIEAMRPAAKDLVAQLEGSIDPSIERIYVTRNTDTAFYSAFDHVLREELTYRGFELATQPDPSALSITLSASKAARAKAKNASVSTDPEMYNVMLSGSAGTLASGSYGLPAFAFTESSAPKAPETKGVLAGPDAQSQSQAKMADTSAPVPITQVTAEPLDLQTPAAPASDLPAQMQTTP